MTDTPMRMFDDETMLRLPSYVISAIQQTLTLSQVRIFNG